MKRMDAFALVRKHGGKPRKGVTKQTDVLIVGELGWPLLDDGRPSNSLAQAKSYRVPIASERQFLEWLGRSAPEEQAKAYTADQLASLSKLPKEIVDQLSMFGLIEARAELYGFRDLAAARQVAGLLSTGIALSVITRSLHEIRKWLPDARLSNLRLFPESSDRLLVEQMNGRTDKNGQFVLDVEKPADDADAIFEEAQAAEEQNDAATAERLYRRLMKMDPADPTAPFNLGNVLRSSWPQLRGRDRLPRRREGRSRIRAGLVQSRRCLGRSVPQQGRGRLPAARARCRSKIRGCHVQHGPITATTRAARRSDALVEAVSRGRQQLPLGHPRQTSSEILRNAALHFDL